MYNISSLCDFFFLSYNEKLLKPVNFSVMFTVFCQFFPCNFLRIKNIEKWLISAIYIQLSTKKLFWSRRSKHVFYPKSYTRTKKNAHHCKTYIFFASLKIKNFQKERYVTLDNKVSSSKVNRLKFGWLKI